VGVARAQPRARYRRPMDENDELVVEIHIPLVAPAVEVDDVLHPWIDEVLDYLDDVESRGEAVIIDEGEEFEGAYVFSVADAPERALLKIAGRIAELPGIPTGVFAVVTTEHAEELGRGRRLDLS